MSISGSLEDVSVADVMQFIHLGRRTGTLVLSRGSSQAQIGFHEGRLVSAQSPGTERLGALLVRSGIVNQDAMDRAAELQSSSTEARSIGQILLAEGSLNEADLRKVVTSQIERAVSELITWESGSFEFAVGSLAPVDEIALFPGDVVPGTDINTQMVLLEAARIFDERNRIPAHNLGTGPSSSPAISTAAEAEREEASDPLDDTHPVFLPTTRVDPSPTQAAVEAEIRIEALGAGEVAVLPVYAVHLVTPDRQLYSELVEALPEATVELRKLSEVGEPSPAGMGELTAGYIILVDLRQGRATLRHIAAVHERHPAIPMIALVDRVLPLPEVFAAGALAAVPAEVEAVVACVHNILQNQQQLAGLAAPHTVIKGGPGGRSGMARLRRVYGDLRSGLLSATVALNLMHIISESVERAVLFLVRQDCLQALGAFGAGADGAPLAELTRGMRLDLDQPTVLADSLNSGETVTGRFAEAALPQRLRGLLGQPLNGQIVIFPVLGAQRVISVIYTDNGQVDRPIEDIEILELATAQVGMAFENELLRRQIARQQVD
jgi:hypothetical protein